MPESNDNHPAGAPERELEAIWGSVRAELRDSLPAAAAEHWLEPLRAVAVRGSSLYLSGPDRVRGWFERRYGEMANAALRSQGSGLSEIVFADPSTQLGGNPQQPAQGAPIPAALARDRGFDRFVIGPGNRFAHAAALAVAELPGDAYNPLFIYGSPGLGKTHLLVAIAGYIRDRHPELDVLYTTAERFTTEFVSSVRGGGAAEFKRRHRAIGALLIDDIQFLEDKPKTEDEFFHTFNELHSAGAQIVLSSDRPPEAIERLSERLRDRFAWGLTVKVDEPDLRTRIALLQHLAVRRAIPMPDIDVLRQIALASPSNLRKLEGALTRVAAFASMLGEAPSAEIVAEALGKDPRAPACETNLDGEPGVEAIAEAVCSVLRLSRADLSSSRRTPDVVRGRQLAMYVTRNTTNLSLVEIARAFNRDHSTVLHSIRTIEKRIEPGSDLHLALEQVHNRLHIRPERP